MKYLAILLLILFSGKSPGSIKYIVPCSRALLEASLDTLLAQVGTMERTNKNDGDVENYILSVGGRAGQPYCAAGQYYCFLRAAEALDINPDNIPILKTASTNKMLKAAKRHGKKSAGIIARHDLIFWRKMASPGGHVERVLKAGKAGWVKTVAFNTSSRLADGSLAEGVFIKYRNVLHPLTKMLFAGAISFGDRSGGDYGR